MLEDEYRKIAKNNQLSGLINQNTSSVGNPTNGRTDSRVAEEVGFGSKETYRQAKYIHENADEEEK